MFDSQEGGFGYLRDALIFQGFCFFEWPKYVCVRARAALTLPPTRLKKTPHIAHLRTSAAAVSGA